MSLQDLFDCQTDSVDLHNDFGLNWSAKGVGFGQFYFYNKDEKLYCSNEFMDKDFIKRVLCQMVDQCELEYKREEL